MIMRQIRFGLLFVLLLTFTFWSRQCLADIIENGDFSRFDHATGLPTGWDHFDDGGTLIPPEYLVDGVERYMRFFERSQLEQGFDLPAEARLLSFEYRMDQEGLGTGSLRDSFQATLYDPAFNPLLGAPFGFFSVDFKDTYFDPNYVSLQQLTSGWYKVTLDVASLPPMDGVLLEFLVNGFDDGQTTTVYLDNVSLSAVPEPAAPAIFVAVAVPLMFFARRYYRQKPK
jgi:hypothetical protein